MESITQKCTAVSESRSYIVEKVGRLVSYIKSPEYELTVYKLNNSSALLSRLIGRRKKSLRSMYGFKSIQKLYTAVHCLRKTDIYEILSTFIQNVSTSSYKDMHLPNQYKYGLIKLISIHKLYQKIINNCFQSADYFLKLLKNNYFMDSITLFLTIVSNIWDCTVKLANTFSNIYREMISLQGDLSTIQFQNYQVPPQLQNFQILSKPGFSSNKVKTNTGKSEQISISKTKAPGDIGISIKRDSLQPSVDFSRINTIQDIQIFFKMENKRRKDSINTCATKLILHHDWLRIENIIQKMILARNNKKVLSLFRNLITNKV